MTATFVCTNCTIQSLELPMLPFVQGPRLSASRVEKTGIPGKRDTLLVRQPRCHASHDGKLFPQVGTVRVVERYPSYMYVEERVPRPGTRPNKLRAIIYDRRVPGIPTTGA